MDGGAKRPPTTLDGLAGLSGPYFADFRDEPTSVVQKSRVRGDANPLRGKEETLLHESVHTGGQQGRRYVGGKRDPQKPDGMSSPPGLPEWASCKLVASALAEARG